MRLNEGVKYNGIPVTSDNSPMRRDNSKTVQNIIIDMSQY